MRIRKRQVPLPLSSLSPAPLVSLPDPTIHISPPLHPISPNPKPSYPEPIDAWDSSGKPSGAQKEKNQDCVGVLQIEERRQLEEKEKDNVFRTRDIFGSQEATDDVQHLSSHQPAVILNGRWCDGEKAFPLKKRRGTLMEMIAAGAENNTHKKMAKITKMNKKYSSTSSLENDSNINIRMEDEEEEGEGEGEGEEEKGYKYDNVKEEEKRKVGLVSNMNMNKKNSTHSKRILMRGSSSGAVVLKEGSRCSRVNGRGWRCCQQTLVGYSLCEHHLGKGRLRSMNSTTVSISSLVLAAGTSNCSSSIAFGAPKKNDLSGSPSISWAGEAEAIGCSEDKKEDKKKPSMIGTKKRVMKLGMMKARSLSSLLGQTSSNQVTAAPQDM